MKMKIISGYEDCIKEGLVLTFGNFDGVHAGHNLIISSVKKTALIRGIPSAVITFSPHPSTIFQHKKNFLLSSLEQKTELISKHKVDYLYIINFDEEFQKISADDFITEILVKKLNMKHITVGNNCSFGNKRKGNVATIEHYSSILKYDVNILKPITYNSVTYSSSLIRHYLENGNIDKANKLLKRNYQIIGKVVIGKGRGATMGFPTANIQTEKNIMVPKLGVYQAKLNVSNTYFDAVVNIGIRPTFNDLIDPLVEAHILNFNDNIYGCITKIELLKFIRPEKKFNSVEQLKNQLHADIKQIKQG